MKLYLIYVSRSFVMPSAKSFVLCFRDKTCGCSRNELYIWGSAQSPWWNLCEGSHCFPRLSQRWNSDVTTFHAICLNEIYLIIFKTTWFSIQLCRREVIDEDGWLHTGDIGTWLPGGRLKIIDRWDSIILIVILIHD